MGLQDSCVFVFWSLQEGRFDIVPILVFHTNISKHVKISVYRHRTHHLLFLSFAFFFRPPESKEVCRWFYMQIVSFR